MYKQGPNISMILIKEYDNYFHIRLTLDHY